MQRTIMITYWKAAGVPHLPLIHSKTGMSEALRKYFAVEGIEKSPENLSKRKTALEGILKVIKQMKKDMPPDKHPKLNATLKLMKAGVIAEVADYNAFFEAVTTWAYVKNNAEVNTLFRAHCGKEFSTENFDFLTAVDEKNHPNIIFTTFIDAASPTQVNLPASVEAALVANHATLASYKDAYANIMKLMQNDTMKRFRAQNELTIAAG